MPTAHDFIFLDKHKSRWNKLIRRLRLAFILFDIIFILTLLTVYVTPTFTENLKQKIGFSPQEVIDTISAKKAGTIEVEGIGPLVNIINDQNTLSLERGGFSSQKVVILTFDDGPDPIYTPKILEVLKKEAVPAIFFVVGEQLFRHPKIANQIIKEGHQIGAHTFTHTPENMDLYTQQDKLKLELDFTQKLLQAQTGMKTRLFRIPYWGAEETISLNSLVLLVHATDRGYITFSSTVDSFDWQLSDPKKVAQSAIRTDQPQVILLHDAGGDRTSTLTALPEIIKAYKEAGFVFSTADTILTSPAMVETPLLERISAYIATFIYWLKINFFNLLNWLFRVDLGIIGLSTLVTLALAIFHSLKISKYKFSSNSKELFTPFISVLVPAFNEERTIAKTVNSLLASDYPGFEIIVIDNNSKDNTASTVNMYLPSENIKIIKESRQGKFHALNTGVKEALGEIVVIIDADTQILPNTLMELVQPFQNPKVGATAGHLKVGNIKNLLTALQGVEYILGLNLDRRAYDILHSIPVVPGALGAWRKKVVKKVGGYEGNTLTEDADLTIKVQAKGYLVKFVSTAVAFTEAPETMEAFLKQRSRWTFGMLQVLYKHKRMFFRKKYGLLGMSVLPYIFLIQIPLMMISPIVDIVAVLFLVLVSSNLIALYFLIFLILQLILATVGFIIAKEPRIWLIFSIPLYRLFYQLLYYFILYRAILKALRGSFVPWQKLTHLGSVDIINPPPDLLREINMAEKTVLAQEVTK